MNPAQSETSRTLTVLESKEIAVREAKLLKVTIYPWGVEFDLPEKEAQE